MVEDSWGLTLLSQSEHVKWLRRPVEGGEDTLEVRRDSVTAHLMSNHPVSVWEVKHLLWESGPLHPNGHAP